jgi:hypothetical protein
MKLFTKALLKEIPTLDETAELGIDKSIVYAKFFSPVGAGTWYITAYDPIHNEAFGYVNLGDSDMAELGYIPMGELESLRLPFGLKIERDMHFTKTPLKQVMDTIQGGGHI